jgi:hypothetical protein
MIQCILLVIRYIFDNARYKNQKMFITVLKTVRHVFLNQMKPLHTV